MKKLARILSLMLVLAMTLSLCACSGSSKNIEIKFIVCEYSDNTETYMKQIISDYEAEHKNVTINLEMVSWDDAATRINTLITGNQAPDILNLDSYSQYLEDNLLLPITDYVSDTQMAAFYPDFLNYNVATDGVSYCLPFVASVRNLYYNKDIFDEVGIAAAPATWDELEADCKAISEFYKGDVYPMGMDFTTNEGQSNFSYYAWNFGGDWVDENGNFVVNSAENVKALEFAVNLYKEGYTNANPLTETRDDMQGMMNEGKLAMMFTACFFPALYPDLNLGIAPIPNDGNQKSIQLGVQDRIMVFDNDYSDAKLTAIGDFVAYLLGCGTYADWCLKEGLLPVTTDAMATLISKDDIYNTFNDALQSVKFYPSYLENWTDVKDAVIQAEQSVASGTLDAQTALDQAQAVADAG